LKPYTKLILRAISAELGQLSNHIIIEGHTDKTPYSQRNQYTNWELSADRANSARRHMEEVGIRDGQIVEIRGYADKHPKLPDDPYDPRNRRIAIIVLNREFDSRYRSLADGDGEI
jgi:chemotaxis protein MotB